MVESDLRSPIKRNMKYGGSFILITTISEKKNYFVGKASINGKIVQTERIDKIIDAETGKAIFTDAFQITEYADVENYKNKDAFIMNLLSVAYFILKAEGEIEGAVILKAMEEGTDICKWGIRMEIIDNEKFQYETFDCTTKN